MENKYFENARKKAVYFLKNNEMLDRLLEDSRQKVRNLNLDKFSFRKLYDYLMVLVRMVQSYADGTYRVVPWQSILVIVAAIIYFVTPVDLIPDFIPVAGLVDDLGVLVWVFNKMREEIDDYIAWEQHNQVG